MVMSSSIDLVPYGDKPLAQCIDAEGYRHELMVSPRDLPYKRNTFTMYLETPDASRPEKLHIGWRKHGYRNDSLLGFCSTTGWSEDVFSLKDNGKLLVDNSDPQGEEVHILEPGQEYFYTFFLRSALKPYNSLSMFARLFIRPAPLPGGIYCRFRSKLCVESLEQMAERLRKTDDVMRAFGNVGETALGISKFEIRDDPALQALLERHKQSPPASPTRQKAEPKKPDPRARLQERVEQLKRGFDDEEALREVGRQQIADIEALVKRKEISEKEANDRINRVKTRVNQAIQQMLNDRR